MKKMKYEELYTDIDSATGEDIFFLDRDLNQPYNGVVEEYFNGKLSWTFDVKDGYRNGKEKRFYDDTGKLMEVNDIVKNTVTGVSKEYYQSGKLKSVGLAINNIFIDSIHFDESGKVVERSCIQEDNFAYGLVKDRIPQFRERYHIESYIY